eukprot:g3644.t1
MADDTARALLLLYLCLSYIQARRTAKDWCTRGDVCWPTAGDLAALEAALDPSANRTLAFAGPGTPRPCAVPLDSPDEQPLYGLGIGGLRPVYTNDSLADGTACIAGGAPEARGLCLAAVRNSPFTPNAPQIVVFPTKAAHVQTAVRFAVAHNLCIAVAGTGHDFLNRHSCDADSLLVRTTLLQGAAQWDLRDRRGFGAAAGTVRVGAGSTFSELAHEAARRGRVLAQGWGVTVGVAGWSLGGGHGPFANALGLGVDNVLEAEVVVADGSLVVANASSNADLFWALRGGGGSTWGIVTALTLRAHVLPPGGITQAVVQYVGTYCAGRTAGGALNHTVDALLQWGLSLPAAVSGIHFVTPFASSTVPGGLGPGLWPGRPTCGGVWQVTTVLNYLGGADDAAIVQALGTYNATVLAAALAADEAHVTNYTVSSYADQWARARFYPLSAAGDVQPQQPPAYLPGTPGVGSSGGLVSVLVSREACTADGGGSSAVGALLKARLRDCARNASTDPRAACNTVQLYQDLTGNVGAAQPNGTSISPAFRRALMHVVAMGWDEDRAAGFHALSDYSYLSESAWHMPGGAAGWQRRLWGSNYHKLLAIKMSRDPNAYP